MYEFEIDWMFFLILFLLFITAGLIAGKTKYDEKLEKKKQEVEEFEKNKYGDIEKRIRVLEEKLL